MADYYLKTDNIMKNMFTVALKDELAAQSRMGTQCPQSAAGQVSCHGQVQRRH